MTATVPPAVPAGADVATLRVTGKTVVADGVLTLELAAPSGGQAARLDAGLAHRPDCCRTG